MKARNANAALDFQSIPNIGPTTANDFKQLGFQHPRDLVGQDPYHLYQRMCQITGTRQDPCVLDVFISAIDFMQGAPAHPWWHYTAQRKRDYPNL